MRKAGMVTRRMFFRNFNNINPGEAAGPFADGVQRAKRGKGKRGKRDK
jgi:hypothetical protein